jgi:hypothetical protein
VFCQGISATLEAVGGLPAPVAAGTVTPIAADAALVPPEVVLVAVNAYAPADKSAVVKLQAPVLLAVVAPRGFAPPSDTVTTALLGAVPPRVTESSELTTPLLMTGALGGVPLLLRVLLVTVLLLD